MPKLSVVIITHNEEKNILRCLESVQPVADEIVVVDSLSSDGTVEICRNFGCKIISREFEGFGSQKQFAVDLASNDWILSVDADEIVSAELQHEIIQLLSENPVSRIPHPVSRIPHPASRIPHVAYRIPFSLCYMGRILRHGGNGSESHLRLFSRAKGCFTTVPVHEGVEVKGPVGFLNGRIVHYSYLDISHHLEKLNDYTSKAAAGNLKRGKSFSKIWSALKFPASFITVYIFKRGFLDGYPGFIWSFMAAVYATLKVAKTIELTSKP